MKGIGEKGGERMGRREKGREVVSKKKKGRKKERKNRERRKKRVTVSSYHNFVSDGHVPSPSVSSTHYPIRQIISIVGSPHESKSSAQF